MGQRVTDSGTVVNAHGRERVATLLRTVPQRDDANMHVAQVLDQPRFVTQIPEQHDRVAVARLEHRGERQGLVRRCARVPEDHRIPTLGGRDRERLDRAREERIGDVADNGAEQHRRRPAQRPGARVRPVAELARDRLDALPGLR